MARGPGSLYWPYELRVDVGMAEEREGKRQDQRRKDPNRYE